MAKIAVIGAGFSGMSASAYLAAAGHEVKVYEKNKTAGGRARQLKTNNGYTFDMGPSWYWMPDVFEGFFNDFDHTATDFYHLKQLDPAFEMVFHQTENLLIPSDFSKLCQLFESVEKGTSRRLKKFMAEAKFKYEVGMNDMAKKPGLSLSEFMDINLLKNAAHLQLFSSFSKHVRKHFSDPKLIALMEFPVLFLGAMPQKTPALYSLMNYAGLKLGTWYPEGGFGKVVEAVKQVAKSKGATFHYNSPVEKIIVDNNAVHSVIINNKQFACDCIIASADYNHVENLLPSKFRNYNERYWEGKTFAPSCLIYFVGTTKKIAGLQHHTLFFEHSLLQHSKDIYKNTQWPDKPLFYLCCPSKTDDSLAPAGHETLFMLMPVAAGLKDRKAIREKYFEVMIERVEKHAGEPIKQYINFKQSYCINDFKTDYHSYKGNAYGLANTLNQTAIMKPKIKNKRIRNLFYSGQLTVPGPGVPPALISGKISSELLLKHLNNAV